MNIKDFKGIGSRILEKIPGTKAHNEAGIKRSLHQIDAIDALSSSAGKKIQDAIDEGNVHFRSVGLRD